MVRPSAVLSLGAAVLIGSCTNNVAANKVYTSMLKTEKIVIFTPGDKGIVAPESVAFKPSTGLILTAFDNGADTTHSDGLISGLSMQRLVDDQYMESIADFSVDMEDYYPTSVAYSENHDELAIAIASRDPLKLGKLYVFHSVEKWESCNCCDSKDNFYVLPTGYHPTMVTFTPDGKHIVVSNEGMSLDYSCKFDDPEGSVSIYKKKHSHQSHGTYHKYDKYEACTTDHRRFDEPGHTDALKRRDVPATGDGSTEISQTSAGNLPTRNVEHDQPGHISFPGKAVQEQKDPGHLKVQKISVFADGPVTHEVQRVTLNSEDNDFNATSGTFTVSMVGANSGVDVPFNASSQDFEDLLGTLEIVQDVTVSRHDISVMEWMITFRDPVGDIPSLAVDTYNLVGKATKADITEVAKGSSSLFGTFGLSFGRSFTSQLPVDASVQQVEAALGNLDVSVSRNSIEKGLEWLVTFTGSPEDDDTIEAHGTDPLVYSLHSGGGDPLPLGGSFTLIYAGVLSVQIPYNITDENFNMVLQSYPELGRVHVASVPDHDGRTNWVLTFRDVCAPEDPISVDTTTMTGTNPWMIVKQRACGCDKSVISKSPAVLTVEEMQSIQVSSSQVDPWLHVELDNGDAQAYSGGTFSSRALVLVDSDIYLADPYDSTSWWTICIILIARYVVYVVLAIVYIIYTPTDRHCEEGKQSFFAHFFAAVTIGLVCGLFQLCGLALPVLAWFGCIWSESWPWWSAACWLLFGAILTNPFWPLDNKLPWERYTRCYMFRAWAKYFQLKVIVEGGLEEGRRYLIAQSPHGVVPIGVILAQTRSIIDLPGIQPSGGIVATMALRAFGLRHIFGWLGARPASQGNIRAMFAEGYKGVGVVIGGIAETFMVSRTQERLYVKKRLGFTRTAIVNGVDILPVFVYGNSLLHGIYGRQYLRRISRAIKITICPLHGAVLTIPRRQQLVMVVGRPVKVPSIANPSDAEVKEVHDRYVNEVKRLWHQHKPSWETRELSLE